MFTNSSERKKARMQGADFDKLSLRQYNLIIGLTVLYGFVVNAIMVWQLSDFFIKMNPTVLLIGYFAMVIIGTLMANSKSALVSFIGYNFIVVPIGSLVAINVPFYEVSSVISAIVATAGVVAVMIIISSLYPRLFQKMGPALFIALLLGLVACVIATFMGYAGNAFHWFFVILFSLYVGYDWFRAQSYPRTLDNAVDSAIDLYVDAINLFIRLLAIFGRNDD